MGSSKVAREMVKKVAYYRLGSLVCLLLTTVFFIYNI